MRLSDKIKYMFYGAVIALIGFSVGSLVTSINAHEDGIFGTVHAERIVASEFIADRIMASEFIGVGEPKKAKVMIGTRENGGEIFLSDKNGESRINLAVTESGGVIIVKSNEGEGDIRLHGNLFGGGMMSGQSNEGNGVFSLSAGRWIWVKGENGEVTLEMTGMGGRVKVQDINGIERQLATEK